MNNNAKLASQYWADFDNEFGFSVFESTEETSGLSVNVGHSVTNVVNGKVHRRIQNETLKQLKEFLSMTFGPMGSNTKIIKGNNRETINSSYSKDGLKVLQNIINAGPIEMSIIEEIVEITRHVEHEVGDGTTSTVILSSLIFEKLMKIQEKHNVPPYQLIRTFESIVDIIKSSILDSKQECTLDEIYNISMISTNGNDEVSRNITNIYEKFGMGVDLSVGISNTSDSLIKEYDGLTITEGMSDPVYINNREKGTSEIYNARIYHFKDPVDTMDMISLFERIIQHNIYEAYAEEVAPTPTVIVCPRISKDTSNILKKLANTLYQFDQADSSNHKPPILIITNVVASDEIIMDDIANLCGCKSIQKYIDPNMLRKDQESGDAPTLDNVWEFCGHAEMVISDAKKTKFINPQHMHKFTEDGEMVEDPIYTAMINFLETEIANTKSTDSAHDIGLLKKRLSALKANAVDYLVGGITIAERDATKDLVEDAIKNCKSATLYGVGYAANFEGLYHSFKLCKETMNHDHDDKVVETVSELELDIMRAIFAAYCEATAILYGTVCNDKKVVAEFIFDSLEKGHPFDISSGVLTKDEYSGSMVKCSIMLDINILDTLSKIITLMVTSNQCLLQAANLNTYK